MLTLTQHRLFRSSFKNSSDGKRVHIETKDQDENVRSLALLSISFVFICTKLKERKPPKKTNFKVLFWLASHKRNMNDNRGLGVVRVKPLGAGGGGGERSSVTGVSTVSYGNNSINVGSKSYSYPKMVIGPEVEQEALFNEFMPSRIQGFFDGFNVNVIAYGQTGSGKTHTMFGTPGILRDAALGKFGHEVTPNYGLFPRGMIAIFKMLKSVRAENPGKSYVLTCSAVELSAMGDEDMFGKDYGAKRKFDNSMYGFAGGVALDNAETPPKLYGMTQLILEQEEDLLRAFGALSTRNTAGTEMNDSSSRSQCFAFLCLYVHDEASDTVQQSRFQFCDLAGSERMVNAHGSHNWKQGGMEAINGLMTNYSLMMLGQCVVDLVSERKKGKQMRAFRAYKVNLIPLLSESLSGNALTALFVCISQAEANVSQSKFSMDFGKNFSRLTIKRKRVKPVNRKEVLKQIKHDYEHGKHHLKRPPSDKYKAMRKARAFECLQLLQVYSRLVVD